MSSLQQSPSAVNPEALPPSPNQMLPPPPPPPHAGESLPGKPQHHSARLLPASAARLLFQKRGEGGGRRYSLRSQLWAGAGWGLSPLSGDGGGGIPGPWANPLTVPSSQQPTRAEAALQKGVGWGGGGLKKAQEAAGAPPHRFLLSARGPWRRRGPAWACGGLPGSYLSRGSIQLVVRLVWSM